MERYLFSDDIHFIRHLSRFDRKIIVGHYPVILLPDHGMARIYHGSRYTDIDTGNERLDAGGRLSCLRLDDGRGILCVGGGSDGLRERDPENSKREKNRHLTY